jgi:hypothetical protein
MIFLGAKIRARSRKDSKGLRLKMQQCDTLMAAPTDAKALSACEVSAFTVQFPVHALSVPLRDFRPGS